MYVVVCNETEIDAAVIVQVPISLLFNMAEVFIQAKHLFLAGIYPVLPVRRSATLRLIYTTIFSWVFTWKILMDRLIELSQVRPKWISAHNSESSHRFHNGIKIPLTVCMILAYFDQFFPFCREPGDFSSFRYKIY